MHIPFLTAVAVLRSEGSCQGSSAGVDVSGPLDPDRRHHTGRAETKTRSESVTVLEQRQRRTHED